MQTLLTGDFEVGNSQLCCLRVHGSQLSLNMQYPLMATALKPNTSETKGHPNICNASHDFICHILLFISQILLTQWLCMVSA